MNAASSPMPLRRWWEELPEDVHRRSNATDMEPRYPWRVAVTAALDLGLRTTASTVAAASMAPLLFSDQMMLDELASWKEYQQLADEGDADSLHPPPPRGIRVTEARRRLGFRPGVPYRLLSFDSPYRPVNAERARAYGLHRANASAYAQYWYHPSGPRPTLIAIHGFMADRYWLNTRLLSLRSFYEGYDILLYTLPFHGYRTEFPTPFSGYGLLGHGVAHFNEGMRQAVHDLRVFMDWLQQRGVRQIGVTGVSLGGYTSALLASVDDRLSFCIPNAPVVTPADLACQWQPLGCLVDLLRMRYGVTLKQLRHAMALQCPLSFSPKISADRLLIIGGAGDRLTPPWQVRLLHEHWSGSQLVWYPGNHVLHLKQNEYIKTMLAFMDRHCFN
jgi:pimeloyl-ACP methyl ester carboxylesterase